MNPVEPLVTDLYSPDAHARYTAVCQLRQLGAEALGPLGAVVQGEFPLPRLKRPTGFLNRGPDPHAVAAEARRQAVALLGALTDPRATELLASVIRQDGDERVRAQAALALAQRRDPRALAPLLLALTHTDFEVRADAAEALGQLGDRRAVEPLITMMQVDGQTVARWRAMEALGRLGDPRALPPLLNLLQRLLALPALDWAPPDQAEYGETRQLIWTTCTVALEALERLGDPRALPVLDQLAHEAPARTIGSRAWSIAQHLREHAAHA